MVGVKDSDKPNIIFLLFLFWVSLGITKELSLYNPSSCEYHDNFNIYYTKYYTLFKS